MLLISQGMWLILTNGGGLAPAACIPMQYFTRLPLRGLVCRHLSASRWRRLYCCRCAFRYNESWGRIRVMPVEVLEREE